MDVVHVIALALSISLLAGWRVYFVVFAVGLAMRFGWIDLPQSFQSFDVLANEWVLAVAVLAAIVEFLADKVAWLDSAWDAVHTFIRPVIGALLALAIVDPSDPIWQIISLLLGGNAALLAHGAKAGTRALVNLSPEPVSNVIVSGGEDIATAGLLIGVLANPFLAIVIAFCLLLGTILLFWWITRLLRRRRAMFAPKAEP